MTNRQDPAFGIIFDADGLLVDSEPVSLHALKTFYAEQGAELSESDMHSAIGRTDQDVMDAYNHKFKLNVTIEQFRQGRVDHYHARAEEEGVRAFPGVRDLLEEIREAGVPRSIATSGSRWKVEMNLRLANLEGFFDVIVDGSMIENGKPAPDSFLAAARAIDVDPIHCVALEDSKFGVESARRAGMACVAVTNTFPAAELSHATLVVDSLAGIRLGDLRELARKNVEGAHDAG